MNPVKAKISMDVGHDGEEGEGGERSEVSDIALGLDVLEEHVERY